jgi:hypothetical protein
MSSKILKISNPWFLQLATEVDKISEAKKPKISKALQEALYAYTLAKLSSKKPTKEEEKIFREGRKALKEGEKFLTLKELENELGSLHKTKSEKNAN